MTTVEEPNSDHLELYKEYNKTLRTWMVGFGYGVPAIFIINQPAQEQLIKSVDTELIIRLFLIGAAIQIAMTFFNKIVNWCAYLEAFKESQKGKAKANCIVRGFAVFTSWFVIDVIADIASLFCFGNSIYLILKMYNIFLI